jgi:zinc protease
MRFTPVLAAVLVLGACGQNPAPRDVAATPAPKPAPVYKPGPPLTASVSFPHQESLLVPDPAVRWGVLANGVRYALMRSAQPPGRVSLRVRMDSGSLFEDDWMNIYMICLSHKPSCSQQWKQLRLINLHRK